MGAAAESSVPKPKEPSITPEKPVAGVAVDTVGASEPLTNGSVGETELNTDEPPDPTQETIIAGGSPCQGAPKSMANGSADRMDDDAPIADVEDGAPENGDNKEGKGAQGENSEDDPFAGLNDVASMDIYELSNYTFGKKNEESKCKAMQQLPKAQIAAALRKNYEERGMRRSVGGILLVHAHNFPHVLLLQRSDGKGEYALPGGRLRPGESDDEGLRRKLDAKLKHPGLSDEEDQELEIGEKICNWYAIDFQRRYYPYVPAHVTKPKEELHVYTVLLPNKFMFSVPKNLQLVAVPLFELFNNPSTYGDVISAIPALLSRWHINYC